MKIGVTVTQFDTLPEGTTTMRELLERTGLLRETLRAKLRSSKVVALGLHGRGNNKTSVFHTKDVEFIYSIDFSGYKKVNMTQGYNVKDAPEYPFSNKMALKTIRFGL